MKSGAQLIAAERARHTTKEGYTATHDDDHTDGQLADAARAFAAVAVDQVKYPHAEFFSAAVKKGLQDWPWDESDGWKPTLDPVRNLVKAGALIAAEIDRIQRLKADKP